MKLRTYLVKRTIHMMITVLIVLVLLFVLYRMMPGSAAATMMMNPKMTQTEIDLVLVRYGFGRWADYPGQYTVGNYNPQTIGRYTVTVEAVGDNNQVGSFSTHFDVNAPEDLDYVAPQIMDVGILNASIGQKGEFFIRAFDMGSIRSVDATIICPNYTIVGDDLRLFTESFPLLRIDNMTDEVNKTYYYAGSTKSTLTSVPGNSNFTISFEVRDAYRNLATAAILFDGSTGTETAKIWGLAAEIPYLDGEYTYPKTGQPLSITSNAIGGLPTFSILMPDSQSSDSITLSGAANVFTGNYAPTMNGILTFRTELGTLSADIPVAVNSQVTTQPSPVQGSASSYPRMTDLLISSLSRDGKEIISPSYPFILNDLRLRINATAVNADGSICSDITAYVLRPDGTVNSFQMHHPTYVQMRTMAEQFVIYMKTMLVFDFGISYMFPGRSAWSVILERVPSTMLLFGSALIVSYILGIMIGVVVAWRRGTVMEMGTIIVTLFFYSMPIFWFALIMQWIFYAQLQWLPLAGMGGINTATGEPLIGLAWYIDRLRHLVMPLVTLVILGLAGTILLMRSSMLEVIGEDFTTTAKAKGLKERTVVYRHVARNAMLPVVTSMAMSIGGIISGGVLTETIFSWYGMGTLLIEGTLSKDFPVVQGAFYIMALLTILGNMGADILYAWLDPRVQL